MKIISSGSPIIAAIGMAYSAMIFGMFRSELYQYTCVNQPGASDGGPQWNSHVPLSGTGTCEASSGQLKRPSCAPGPGWNGTGKLHFQPPFAIERRSFRKIKS